MKKQIAVITEDVIKILGLTCPINTPIYIGESNINHMKSRHPEDYNMYFSYIGIILTKPDYVRLNPKDDSIEYVRRIEINNKFIKVAVRVTASGSYFARSLYALNTNRVLNFIRKGTLKSLTDN